MMPVYKIEEIVQRTFIANVIASNASDALNIYKNRYLNRSNQLVDVISADEESNIAIKEGD